MGARVLVIADSRGKHLQRLLDELGHDMAFTVMVHRGAGMVRAVEGSRRVVTEFRPDLVIVIAGICDVTLRDRHNKYTRLRYMDIDRAVEYATEQAKKAIVLLRELGVDYISLATPTGVDLSRYNKERATPPAMSKTA